MTHYFGYGLYNESWSPQTVLIPIDAIYNDPMMLLHYRSLIEFGRKIYHGRVTLNIKSDKYIVTHEDGTMTTSIPDKRYLDAIEYWNNLLGAVEYDHDGHLPDDYFIYTYYGNHSMPRSADEFYDHCHAMTTFGKVNPARIIVDDLVVVSEVPFGGNCQD